MLGKTMRVLENKVSLVTGASRGIGAATAIKLAEAGSDVILNYRSKRARAEEVARQIEALGRRAVPLQADLTEPAELSRMMSSIEDIFGRLDLLILNASGGLERDKAEDYAMKLNETAQIETAKLSASMMSSGGRIVFVTSHWAHFYGMKPSLPAYDGVAKSKRAGEDALREFGKQLETNGLSLIVVSGDAIEGTITVRLLERKNPGAMTARREETNGLPTVNEFAAAIVQAATDPDLPNGHTVYVGSTEW